MSANSMRVVLVAALLVSAGVLRSHGQSAAPTFVVDPSFPSLPAGKLLGDVSSVAVDARDHVWVIHRPRTVPAGAARATRCPPVLEFDASGSCWRLGRAGARVRVAGARARHLRRRDRRRLDERQQRLRHAAAARPVRRHAAEVHAGGEVPAADRPQRQEHGRRRHGQRQAGRRHDVFRPSERTVRRRRLRQPPRRRLRREDGRVQAHVGRARRHAVQHRARHQGVERRARVRRRPREQARAGVHDRRRSSSRKWPSAPTRRPCRRRPAWRSRPIGRSGCSTSPTSATTRSTSSIARR